MTELNKVRFAWLALPIHERILVLKEAAREDVKGEHTWIKHIPHEMRQFNEFFASYTPLEIFQLKGNSVNGKKYSSHFDINCAYFLFNPETRVLSAVENIEQTLRDLFDAILAKIGPAKMITVYNRIKINGFTQTFPCTVDVKDDSTIAEILKNGNKIYLQLDLNIDGTYTVRDVSRI